MTKYQKQRQVEVRKLIGEVTTGISDLGKYWTPKNGLCSNICLTLSGSITRTDLPSVDLFPSPMGYYETHRAGSRRSKWPDLLQA